MRIKFIVTFMFTLLFYSSLSNGQMMMQNPALSNMQSSTGTSQITCDDPNVVDSIESILDLIIAGNQTSSAQRNALLAFFDNVAQQTQRQVMLECYAIGFLS